MSRIAKKPIEVPSGVTVTVNGNSLAVKGAKGEMSFALDSNVEVVQEDGVLQVRQAGEGHHAHAMAGTTRALVNNMVVGVSQGFERRLTLVGVGYRAAAQGNSLNLTLGFSHPVSYPVPEGVTIETPTQTEIVVRGTDKQKVGQVAADIRAYRPPEPYKGKGVRYSDEVVVRKETKKK
ncbi:MAG: 50S ribosomal protein L6 [Gammaproteobacteria bacterium]|jgi:large subunit ribosomal protein L6|nr:50S ribosomal protein L6 [Gammaproteobacteria bacterium]